MDLATQSTTEKSNTGARMPLLSDATGEVYTHQAKGDKQPREMYLTLLGPESNPAKRYAHQVRNRLNRQGKNFTPSNESIEAERYADSKALAAMTVDGLVFYENKWLELNAENAFDVYYAVETVRNQASTFAYSHANFTQG